MAQKYSGSIPRNACVSAKHSYAWLVRKCDYPTDRRMPDKVIPMCRYASQVTQKVWFAVFCNFIVFLKRISRLWEPTVKNHHCTKIDVYGFSIIGCTNCGRQTYQLTDIWTDQPTNMYKAICHPSLNSFKIRINSTTIPGDAASLTCVSPRWPLTLSTASWTVIGCFSFPVLPIPSEPLGTC